MLILVVDDNEDIRSTLRDMLAINGYESVLAGDGEQGLAMAKRFVPDIIISDVSMPHMGGIEMLKELRKDMSLRSIPVIFASAMRDRSTIREGMENGAADYISKPFKESEVIKSIEARSAQRKMIDEIDAFAHTVAHDLKNPLGSLTLRLDVMEDLVGNASSEKLVKHIGLARDTVELMTRVVNELLLLSVVQQKGVEASAMNMRALISNAIGRSLVVIEKEGARVEVSGEIYDCVGYSPWILHVWGNLICNAATHGGPGASIVVESSKTASGKAIRYEVKDSGRGIPESEQALIWAPFAQSANGSGKGTGLGLSIARRILERLGGTIGVESKVGEGSCFWFELPSA